MHPIAFFRVTDRARVQSPLLYSKLSKELGPFNWRFFSDKFVLFSHFGSKFFFNLLCVNHNKKIHVLLESVPYLWNVFWQSWNVFSKIQKQKLVDRINSYTFIQFQRLDKIERFLQFDMLAILYFINCTDKFQVNFDRACFNCNCVSFIQFSKVFARKRYEKKLINYSRASTVGINRAEKFIKKSMSR